MNIPGLRSPHELTGGIVYFARMLDKVRLHAEGKLPPDYVENLGGGFDLRCVNFLHVKYDDLVAWVKSGQNDEAILEKCFAVGVKPSEEQIEVWNDFMTKRGWNDAATERLKFRLAESNASDRADIQTMFDYIDFDEGRDPVAKA
jgi:gluconokinase